MVFTGRLLDLFISNIVKLDSLRKKEEVKAHNQLFRQNVQKDHERLLSKYEQSAKLQRERWRLKTANSPLRLDQNEIHRQLSDRWKEYFRSQKHLTKQRETLRSMIGKPEFDICSDEFLKSIDDPEKRLAMERRKLLIELKTVKKEELQLSSMIEDSIELAKCALPKVALQLVYGADLEGNSQLSSSSLHKQKVSKEQAALIKQQDLRIYSAAGRYDEFGRFILTNDLKTKAGMLGSEFAQAAGNVGVHTEFEMINSYDIPIEIMNRQAAQLHLPGIRSHTHSPHNQSPKG